MIINVHTRDVLWNYAGVLFSFGSTLIFWPILIHFMSTDLVGIWFIFSSIGGVVQLFDFGFNPTISHSVSYAWSGAADLKKEGAVFASENVGPNMPLVLGVMRACRYLYLRIAILAAVVMLTFGTWYLNKVAYEYMSYEMYFAWIIYIVGVFLNLFIGYYSVVLLGIGDVFRQNEANIFAKIIYVFLGCIGIISGHGLLGISIAFLVSGVFQRFLCKRYLDKCHRFSKFSEASKYNKYTIRNILKTMWHNAWRDGLVTATFYLTGQATVLIAGIFLSLSETGIYSMCMQVMNIIIGIANGSLPALTPAMHSAYANKNKEMARRLYKKAMGGFYALSILGVIGFIIVGVPVISWLKSDFVINRIQFLLLACSMILLTRHRNSAWFISTMNTLPYTFAFIAYAILSVIASYLGLALFNLGIMGLICIPLLVESIYNNWYWNVVVNQYLEISELDIVRTGVIESKEILRKLYKLLIQKAI